MGNAPRNKSTESVFLFGNRVSREFQFFVRVVFPKNVCRFNSYIPSTFSRGSVKKSCGKCESDGEEGKREDGGKCWASVGAIVCHSGDRLAVMTNREHNGMRERRKYCARGFLMSCLVLISSISFQSVRRTFSSTRWSFSSIVLPIFSFRRFPGILTDPSQVKSERAGKIVFDGVAKRTHTCCADKAQRDSDNISRLYSTLVGRRQSERK